MSSTLDAIILSFLYFWLVNIYRILVFCWLNIVFIWPCYNPNHTGGGLGRRENFETLTVAKYYHVRPTLKACNFKSIKAMDFKFSFFPYNCTANNLAYIIKINGLDFFLWSPYFDRHVFQIFYSVVFTKYYWALLQQHLPLW